ncbi:Mrp/NBP35 family ATP-binding protein [Sphingomonas sp. HDW15A]|nr:Mrp/NBP35 family ATP-binding protein [Sphingomonas sp. HDW15A]
MVIAVGSGKGGVGKSTVAANIAVALARAGHKVGMVDADIYGPSQPTLLAAPGRPEAIEKVLQPVETPFGVSLLSIGQLVPAGQALAWRGPMASGALAQLVEGNWADRDFVIVDLPPGTGDVQLSLIQKSKPAGAVIVSTPQDLSLIDAERAVDLFRRTDVPVLGLIENMAGYQCPHCNEVSDPFGQGGAEAGAARLHIPFLGRLALSSSLREASDAGNPPAAGEGPAAKAFADIAGTVRTQLEKSRG